MTGRRAAIVLLALAAGAACTSDAVTLPATWNTLHYRRVSVDIFTRVAAPHDLVRPLQGIDGAPLARDPELPDLILSYWDRPSGSDELDGAHVDVVRVGPELCALTLDGMYLGGAADAPTSFDFAALEAHLASAEDVRGEGIVLALDLSRAGACGAGDPFAAALDAPTTYAEVAASAVRHAIGDGAWNPGAHAYPLLAVQLFRVSDDRRALALFATAARRVRALAPQLAVASPELDSDDADAFLAAVAADDVPLDVLMVRVAGEPRLVAERLRALADSVATSGLDVDIAVSSFSLAPLALPYAADSALGQAHLGASEMALRIFLQDLPVRWFFSGHGPWGVADGALVPSPYFDRDGRATPAFVSRLPMRQLVGDERVIAESDGGEELAVLAARDGATLSILIAHPATATGVGSIRYTLTVPGFSLPTYPEVDFRLAELDQSNRGVPSFFYADLGKLPTDRESGDVHVTRTLPVPGVHLIELDQAGP